MEEIPGSEFDMECDLLLLIIITAINWIKTKTTRTLIPFDWFLVNENWVLPILDALWTATDKSHVIAPSDESELQLIGKFVLKALIVLQVPL